ncbi:CGNR zinc finger domain-containing protein [Nocardia huaxiensis]|uniref:CGNR zinc finger domain-containing protein n=1 Tax=Nocardia huaxiensis TaxID=2755382 RepID=UPI001E607F64|nr:CGNR zinc finger domain-containing protein [Nocardia huaxiensis]UFS96100.1 CGNR zinc finger domain-containing protein [Nocardia huaxiensis]
MEVPQWGDDAAALVLSFVNTRADGAGGVEIFGAAAGFAEWAIERGLLDAATVVTDSDAAAARELRDALVTTLLTHAGDPDIDAAQLAEAERYLRQAGVRYPLTTVVTAQDAQLFAGSSGVPGVLGSVLAAVTETAQRGDWTRIKACCNPPCHFGFIDRTRNRAARFCSPGCGSQVSMRALRQRRKQAETR